MIEYNDLESMVEQLKVGNFRFRDMSENLLYQYENDNPALTIQHIKEVKPKFSTYGRILVQLCSNSHVAQGWKNGFNYTVYFDALKGQQQQPMQQQQPIQNFGSVPGFDIAKIIQLSIENATLKMQLDNQNNKNTLPEIPMSYLGLLESFGLSKPATGSALAGQQPATKLTMQHAAGENPDLDSKLTEYEKLCIDIVGKVDIEKLLKVFKAVATDPGKVDLILPFIK